MYNHPTAEQLRQYSDRTLPADSFDVIHRHVISCPACYDKCGSPTESKQDYADLLSALLPGPDDTPYHLSYEQLAAYVDLELGEADLHAVASHLEVCAQCMSDVRSLQEFKAESLAEPTPYPPKEVASAPRYSFSLPHWHAPRLMKMAAAIVLAIGAVVLLAMIFLRPESPDSAGLPDPPDNSNAADDQGPPESSPPSPDAQADSGNAAQLALLLNDGGSKITLDQQGHVTGLGDLPEPVRQAIESALTTQALQRPRILAELNGKPSTLLSQSSGGVPFRLVSPVGEVVRVDRPTFRWLPLEGASGYKVTVADAELNEVAVSHQLTATEWVTPEPLKPGAIYSWQVTAIKDGQEVTSPVLPAPQAKFKVLGQAESEELARASRTSPRSHLVMGVMYARAGLLAESERELRSLVKENPKSRLAENLLRSVRGLKAGAGNKARTSPRP